MSDYSRPIGPRQPLFVERTYDSAWYGGEWHRRERRREHYEHGSCSPWETLRCDPLLQTHVREA